LNDYRPGPVAPAFSQGPSSFTQYTNGRTASREDKRPDPSKGGLYDNRPKLGKNAAMPGS